MSLFPLRMLWKAIREPSGDHVGCVSCTTLFVVVAQFVVNKGSGSALEGLAFALMIGVLTGTYSTIFIASPVVMWLRNREKPGSSTITVEPETAGPDQSLPAAAS